MGMLWEGKGGVAGGARCWVAGVKCPWVRGYGGRGQQGMAAERGQNKAGGYRVIYRQQTGGVGLVCGALPGAGRKAGWGRRGKVARKGGGVGKGVGEGVGKEAWGTGGRVGRGQGHMPNCPASCPCPCLQKRKSNQPTVSRKMHATRHHAKKAVLCRIAKKVLFKFGKLE